MQEKQIIKLLTKQIKNGKATKRKEIKKKKILKNKKNLEEIEEQLNKILKEYLKIDYKLIINYNN